MDYRKKLFYLTVNYCPNIDELFTQIHDDIYENVTTGLKYKKRLLYDHGWGQEEGYVCYPEPTFNQLISLVDYVPRHIKNNPFFFLLKQNRELNTVCEHNAIGAISIIMQDYVEELIAFLKEKIETDYFDDKQTRKRFQRFVFSREKAKEFGIVTGGSVGTISYSEILQKYDGWSEISQSVIEKVYR